jgi:hypothetical protein
VDEWKALLVGGYFSVDVFLLLSGLLLARRFVNVKRGRALQYCSPRHRVPFDSIFRGSKCVGSRGSPRHRVPFNSILGGSKCVG